MDLIKPDDPRYDEARTVFNAMIDKRPAVIAQCATPADVSRALALARYRESYDVAVRAGGHSVAGDVARTTAASSIDVRPMKEIEVDPDARTVARRCRRAPGASSTAPRRSTGSRPPAGGCRRPASPGSRSAAARAGSSAASGSACDNLVSVDLVTADGARGHRERRREPRPVLGAARRRRQLRRRDLVRVRAAPGRPDRDRRADALARRRRRATSLGVTATSRPTRPTSSASALVFLTGPPEDVRPRAPAGHDACVGIAGLWAGDVDEGAEAIAAVPRPRA